MTTLKPYQIAQRAAAKAGRVGRYLVQDGVPTPLGAHHYVIQERADGKGRRVLTQATLAAKQWLVDFYGR